MSHEISTPLLDQISLPADLRQFSPDLLSALADELRLATINAVATTGGHLGAGLGVVELTIALHYVFDTPKDKLIWDVGHQCYPHKILTGRRGLIKTLRQENGLSGFTKRTESEYDPFGAAHAATSISAGLGFALARDLAGGDHKVICVIGDGSLSAGMAYEAMNNAGAMSSNLLVILNDNEMSISPPVGAMSNYLARLWSGKPYTKFRNFVKWIARHLPAKMELVVRRIEEYTKGIAVGGTLFEELGFLYFGPVDGHDLKALLPVLRNTRNITDKPVFLHIVTQKGKGYPPAEQSSDKYHGVAKFDPATGAQVKSRPTAPTYTKVFAESLIKQAEQDEKIVAITAAMPAGTGLQLFGERFPERCFDVGIAEQHGVTFAAGLACEGYKPFVAIYSTFLQRAYDQLIHDVMLQNLPVRFAIDRAGLVGADGATHAGAYDLAYLGCLPDFVIMACADEAELAHMVATAAAYDGGPCAIRYPRGEGFGIALPAKGQILPIGKGRILQQGSDVAILSLGARLQECIEAAAILTQYGIKVTVADARFAKPIDVVLLADLAENHRDLLLVEEGAPGGFGAQILQYLANHGFLETGLRVRSMHFPDAIIDHAPPARQYAKAGLCRDDIVARILASNQTKYKKA